MGALTREQILSAEDLKTEEVQVPEWGGVVIVQELTATDRDAYETSVVTVEGDDVQINALNMRSKLAALSMVDDAGGRLFTQKDVVALGKKSATAVDRIVDVARRLSGIGDKRLEEAGKD